VTHELLEEQIRKHAAEIRTDGRKFPGLSLLDLVDRDDVPWESLIDTDRSEVREAVLKFAEAIEPELRAFVSGGAD